MKAGTAGGTAKSGTIPSSEGYVSLGGSSDLWGNTLTYSDVNDSGFGVSFYAQGAFTDPVSTGKSYYMKASNFGFSIASGNTINGVLVGIESKWAGTWLGEGLGTDYYVYVDHVRLTVYYSGSSGIKTVVGVAKASVKVVDGLAIASVASITGLT